MGDYGWSMDSGTSQGSVAVEYGRVLEYPKKRNKSQTTTMGDYGWSMNSDTPQGIDAVEYGRVLEYPKRRNKSQTTRKPDLFR